MIYIFAFFVPPLALLLNGQPFSAVFNFVLIVPCILFGLVFPVLFLVPSAHAHHRDLHEARGPQAPRDRGQHRASRPAARLAALTRRVADGLDVVAVGIEHERAVVVRVILRAQARRAVVLAAGRERCAVERIDAGAILGHDRDVQRLLQLAFAADPEVRLAADAEARGRR